jgi:hypothetical protein
MVKAGEAPPPVRLADRDSAQTLKRTPEDRAALQTLGQQFPAVDRATLIHLYYINRSSIEAAQATVAGLRD